MISELTCKRKIVWVLAEKIMKLVKVEKVTKKVLKNIEKNIKCRNKNEIYVTGDGKHSLKFCDDQCYGREGRKQIGYEYSYGWPDKKERDSQEIYTIDPESYYYACA